MTDRILTELDTEGLRAAFLEYTREAFRLIPALDQPRILDAGCGTGLPTVELARLSDGEIVAAEPVSGNDGFMHANSVWREKTAALA